MLYFKLFKNGNIYYFPYNFLEDHVMGRYVESLDHDYLTELAQHVVTPKGDVIKQTYCDLPDTYTDNLLTMYVVEVHDRNMDNMSHSRFYLMTRDDLEKFGKVLVDP